MAKDGLHLTLLCKSCGMPYRQSRSDQLYCSGKCASKGWRDGKKKLIRCAACGVLFLPAKTMQQRYHSVECRLAAETSRKKLNNNGAGKGWSLGKKFVPEFNGKCEICGKAFKTHPYKTKKGHGRFCSMACRSSNNKEWWPKGKSKRGNGGRREDIGGMYFRSSWEANYARYLTILRKSGNIAEWEFEPDTYEFPIKRGSRFYTPDFKIKNMDGSIEYHEVKGYMDQRSATKLRRMAKYHPEVKMVLIDKTAYNAIFKKVRALIPNFEGTLK